MKRKLKLTLLQKTILAISTIVVGSGAALGSMLLYASKSDEVLGSYSATDRNLFKNDYSSIRDENGQLKAKISIVDPLKQKAVASMSEDGTQYWFLNAPEQKMNFTEFFNAYYEKYQESFIQEIKYGSFHFYNEYVLAVRPEKFLDFTKWFINEVAWGPDLLTLDSFRIVPGVERNGNSITLGNHATIHKESSEIKFFPDAFFGTSPLFSISAGSGNARDGLTEPTFTSTVTKYQADGFLKNLVEASILKNAQNLNNSLGLPLYRNENLRSFKNVFFAGRLKGQKIKLLVDSKYEQDYKTYLQALKGYDNAFNDWILNGAEGNPPQLPTSPNTSGADNLVFSANVTEEEFNNALKEFGDKYQEYSYSDLVEYTISEARAIAENPSDGKSTQLILDLKNDNTELSIIYYDTVSTPAQYYAEKLFEKMVNSQIINFLDFYDINQYVGKKVYLYLGEERSYYSNSIQARDNERNFEADKLVEYTITKVEVEGKVLSISMVDKDGKRKVQVFEASETDKDQRLFRSFKYAVGYSGAIVPRILSSTPESLNEKGKDGKLLKGIDSRKFQIYTDSYNGLLDELSEKFPFLMKKQNGPHLEKTIDENGVYKYEIKEGDYTAFSIDDSIGVPIILANTVKDYQGVSTDFLKYVGAHEYGHHYTLEKSQAIDEKDSAVLVGGINVRGGASESSYYSYKALENYIKARTTLLVRRVDALGNPSDKGSFTQFGYIKNDGTNSKWETYEDVWGSKDTNIFSTIKNHNRRFIQTFEGLQEAAENRNIRIGDLFLANSLDSNSGTLNPFIQGVGKVVYQNGDNKEFKTVSIVEMLSQFKDGKGNSLEFTGTTPNTISIKFYDQEVNADGKVVITQFKVFNKDGSPVVNVPLNTPLSDEELEYLQSSTRRIQNNIISLYNLNNYDSGWNSPISSVSGEMALNWSALLDAPTPKSFYDSILYRSDDEEAEYNPEFNGLPGNYASSPDGHISKVRKSNLYYAVSDEDTNAEIIQTMITNLYNSLQSGVNPNFSGSRSNIFYSNKVLSFVDSRNNTRANYVFPAGINRGAASSSITIDQRFAQYYQQFHNTQVRAGYQQSPALLMSQAFGFDQSNTDNPINFANSGVYFLGLDTNNKPINNYLQEISVAKVGYNYLSSSYLTLERAGLYDAFANTVEMVSVNGKKLPMFEFMEDLVEFGSVDYSKATYVGDDKVEAYNWDIDYVKTKFNLDKLKAEIQKEADSERKINILKDEQSLANEAMRRFINSPLIFSIKEFKLKDLEQNKAIFSKDYGMEFFSSQFKDSYIRTSAKTTLPAFNASDFVEKLKEILSNYYDGLAKGQYEANATEKAFENISLNDLFVILGNVSFMETEDENYFLTKFVIGEFSNGTPTSDAVDYFHTKNEPILNDKFTDYVYSMAETLTRDYVQTTYLPSTSDFGNLPSYLTNITESNTGLDFINDASALSIWNDRVNSKIGIANGALFATQRGSNPEELFAKKAKLQQEYNLLLKEKSEEIAKYEKSTPKDLGIDAFTYNVNLNNLRSDYKALSDAVRNKGAELEKSYSYDISRNTVNGNTRIDSSYFGSFSANNNGYFKDRWEKETIGLELYDSTTGEAIEDENIRLLDLNGEKIKSRPRAFFISQLYNYGVGDRTVSGVFRHKEFDAVALYGYVKNEDAAKIHKIKFTNIKTGDVKYLDVNIAKTNNIFYLSKQADPSSKVTLEDEGYSTWISDYALMGKYRDALLFPGNSFTIDFVDKDGNELKDENGKPLFTLGSGRTLSENGKDQDNAPIKITAKGTDSNNQEIDKATIHVDLQFNVIG